MGLIDKVNVEVNGSGDLLSTLSTYTTKILKPNIVDGKNILTQAMISSKNTKYVIKYDYELEEDITIPEGCVLEFDGGSISGAYTVTGTNTSIEAGLIKIFSTDVTLEGTWNVAEAYPEWFGAKGDGVSDDTNAIQKTVDTFQYKTVVLANVYAVYNTINIPSRIIIEGRSMIAQTTLTNAAKIIFKGDGVCINAGGTSETYKREIVLRDFSITKEDSWDASQPDTTGIYIGWSSNLYFENVSIFGFTYGIDNDNLYNNYSIVSIFVRLRIMWCKYGFRGYLLNGTIRDSYIGTNKHNIEFCGKASTIDTVNCENGHGLHIGYSEGINIKNLGWEATDDMLDENGNKYQAIRIDNQSVGITIENSRYATIPSGINIILASGVKSLSLKNICVERPSLIDTTFARINSSTFTVEGGSYKGISNIFYPVSSVGSINNCKFENITNIFHTESTNNKLCLALEDNYLKALYDAGGANRNILLHSDVTVISNTVRYGQLFDQLNTLTGAIYGERLFDSITRQPIYWTPGRWVNSEGFTGAINRSATVNRPKHKNQEGGVLIDSDTGFRYFDTTLGKWISVGSFDAQKNIKWIEFDGAVAGVNRSGTFANKPSASNIYVGFKYFCTDKQTTEGATDGIEIIHKGNNVWVDALGRVVS